MFLKICSGIFLLHFTLFMLMHYHTKAFHHSLVLPFMSVQDHCHNSNGLVVLKVQINYHLYR